MRGASEVRVVEWLPADLVTVRRHTFGELVFGATVRALGRSCVDDIQKNARMHAPKRRARAGAVQWQIASLNDDRTLIFSRVGCLRHLSSQHLNRMKQL